MIKGVGLDQVEVSRIKRSLERHGSKFLARLATDSELADAPSQPTRAAQYWAARFAAKEAFAKALGTGIGSVVELNSVGVKKLKSGKPELTFSASLKRELKKRGITHAHVSLTHTETTATAIVILEGAP